MNDHEAYLMNLAYKSANNLLNKEEKEYLENWLNEDDSIAALFAEMKADFETMNNIVFYHNIDSEAMLEKTYKRISSNHQPKMAYNFKFQICAN